MTQLDLGVLSSLTSAFAWAISTSIYAGVAYQYRATFLNLIKGLFALVLFAVLLWGSSAGVTIQMGIHGVLVLSGIIGILMGDSFFFAALPKIGPTMTSAIQCVAPPLTAMFAWFFLKESIDQGKILGLLMTSVCIAALVYSQKDHSSLRSGGLRSLYLGVILALLSALCQAVGAVVAKPVMANLGTFEVACSRLIFPVLILLALEARASSGLKTSLQDLKKNGHVLKFVLASFIGTFLGLFFMIYGMQNAPVSLALAVNSTYPVWIMVANVIRRKQEISNKGMIFVVGCVCGIWLMI